MKLKRQIESRPVTSRWAAFWLPVIALCWAIFS